MGLRSNKGWEILKSWQFFMTLIKWPFSRVKWPPTFGDEVRSRIESPGSHLLKGKSSYNIFIFGLPAIVSWWAGLATINTTNKTGAGSYFLKIAGWNSLLLSIDLFCGPIFGDPTMFFFFFKSKNSRKQLLGIFWGGITWKFDGWNPANQLRLVVYLIIYDGFYTSFRCFAGFLNHQQLGIFTYLYHKIKPYIYYGIYIYQV